jgi:hypothetical protein
MQRDARRAQLAMRVVCARSCLLDVDRSDVTVRTLGQRCGRDKEQLRERHESRDRAQLVTEPHPELWSRTSHHECRIVSTAGMGYPRGGLSDPWSNAPRGHSSVCMPPRSTGPDGHLDEQPIV